MEIEREKEFEYLILRKGEKMDDVNQIKRDRGGKRKRKRGVDEIRKSDKHGEWERGRERGERKEKGERGREKRENERDGVGRGGGGGGGGRAGSKTR